MNHFETILNDHQRKVAEGGKNAECRNKEMAISRRLEGLRSSRLDHSMQNFMAVLFRRVPRPDSPDLAGKIIKNWGVTAEGGKDRRRRERSPKAEKIAEGGKLSGMGSQELRFCPWGYFFMENSNLTSRRAKKQKSS